LSYGPASARAASPPRARRQRCLPVLRVFAADRAVLAQLHSIRIVALVLVARVVPAAALRARPPEPAIVNTALPRHETAPSGRWATAPRLPGMTPRQRGPARIVGQDKSSRRSTDLPARLTGSVYLLPMYHNTTGAVKACRQARGPTTPGAGAAAARNARRAGHRAPVRPR